MALLHSSRFQSQIMNGLTDLIESRGVLAQILVNTVGLQARALFIWSSVSRAHSFVCLDQLEVNVRSSAPMTLKHALIWYKWFSFSPEYINQTITEWFGLEGP